MDKNLIYDVGMHNGDDTAYYLSLGYRVVAIDASPDLVRAAEYRFRTAISEKKLEILNLGIASGDGYLDFYLNKINSVWNSFDKSIGTRDGAETEIIKVRTVSIDQVMKEKGVPYYMKIDIEGHDILCLDALMSSKERPRFISVEVNDSDLLSKLNDLGYTRFKIIHQASLLPLQIPPLEEYEMYQKHVGFKQSRNIVVRGIRKFFGGMIHKAYERKYRHLFTYDHPYGSSGPFGEALPGRWMDFDGIVKIYEHYKSLHLNSKWDTGYNYWIDVHATRDE